jgi:ABC-type phosphate transport system substrate-binding protein
MLHRLQPYDIPDRSLRPNRRQALLFFGLCAALTVARGAASETNGNLGNFRVIVHPDNEATALSREFLANVFLRNVRDWDGGVGILPVDLPPSSSAREEFSRRILLRSVSAVRSYWQQRIFTGRGVPPPELDSDAAVVRYVTSNRGAVGYVSKSAELDSARVVTVR